MSRVRLAGKGDAGAIAAIYAPHVRDEVTSFEADPPGITEMRRRIAGAGELYPWLVVVEDEVVRGFAHASPFRTRPAYRWTVESSVYLAADARGRGLGRSLYETLLRLMTAQGFAQAVGLIALPNDASVRLHERLGFRQVGVNPAVGFKLGRWIDVGLWQRSLLDMGDGEPAPVRPLRPIFDGPTGPAG